MPIQPFPNPMLTALCGPFQAPAAWPRLLEAAASGEPWFLELVCRLTQGANGTVLVFTANPLLAAAAASAPHAQVFCSTHNLDEAQSLLARLGLESRTAFSSAPPTELAVALDLQPALLVVDQPGDAAPLLPQLAPGAVVAAAQPGEPPSGLIPWAASRIFLTPANGAIPRPLIPEAAFAAIRAALPDSLDEARRHLPDTPPVHTRPPGPWPLAPAPSAPLPATLPGGTPWPKISIVTPSFNQGRYIEDTILSVANQNYPNVEHIVIDGGSTDETPGVLERHRHRLAAAISEPDRGQSHAINKGMALATGELLTWLNSDDLLAPGALAAMAMAFHTSQADLVAGAVLVFSGGQFVDLHLTSCDPGPLPLHDLLDVDGCWMGGQFFYQPEVMFTRELFERAGGSVREDLFYSMDYDLWVRFAQAGARLHVIGRPICWFRQHPEQKTHTTSRFKAELDEYRRDFLARTNLPLDQRPTPPTSPRQGLRIVMVNDHGFQFGAGLAHQRLAETLALAGHQVEPLTLLGRGAGPNPDGLLHAVRDRDPDLVLAGNLHSSTPSPRPLAEVARHYPTFAILHDLWWLTGRCAYNEDCLKYQTGCDASCPTASEYPSLPPARIASAWQEKRDILASPQAPILLGNSEWTAGFARETLASWGLDNPAARTARIKLSFPLDLFAPFHKPLARRLLGLPLDRFLVLVSGELQERRKRTHEAFEALRILGRDDITVISLGHHLKDEAFPVPDVRRPGYVTDPTELALYKAAADLNVSPSLDETFGQIFIESAACGTPSIGYRRSGITEAIADSVSGLLLDQPSPAALSAAIARLHDDPTLRESLAVWGRLLVENEWSPFSSYHSLFTLWRRTGLTARLGMLPKIGFRSHPAAVPDPEPIVRPPGLRIDPLDLGSEEGPFEELGLPRFRWALGPISRFRIRAEHSGPHSLFLYYRNLRHGQSVRIRANGGETRPYPMPVTTFRKGRLICAPVHLQAGPNEVELEFGTWDTNPHDPRPMAVVLTDVLCIPDPSPE